MALTDHAPHNMTGSSSPSPFVVSHSSCYPGMDGWHAFDGTWGGGAYWIADAPTGWLAIDLGTDHTPTYYGIRANSIPEPNRCPHDWTFEGSSDGSSWSTLDTRTDESAWGNAELRVYAITSPTAYRYFRLNVTANNGDGSYLIVGEFYIYEGTLDPPDARVTQATVEGAFGEVTADARVSHASVETAFGEAAAEARVSHAAAEVVILTDNEPLRVSQVVAEILAPMVIATRVTQIVAELLTPTVIETRATQLVAELLDASTHPIRVTQIVVELLGKSSTYCGPPSLSPAALCGKPDVLAWLEWTVPMKN